jgi:hypothetical protein
VPEQQAIAMILQYLSITDRDLAIAKLRALDQYPEHADTITHIVRGLRLEKELGSMPEDSDEAQRIRRELMECWQKAMKWRDSEHELKGDFWLPGEMERMQKERGGWY